MWPFNKKEQPVQDTYGQNLGMSPTTTGLEAPPPVEESYDRLTPGGLSMPTTSPSPYQSPTTPVTQLQQQSQTQDIQIVSAKLDTIKALLDMLNQRLIAIEKHVEEKQKQKLW